MEEMLLTSEVIALSPLIVVIVTQGLFTFSDYLARKNLKAPSGDRSGFDVRRLWSPWFALYLGVREVATLGQLYVLANVELGRTAGLFAAVSLLMANAIGVLFLGDALSRRGYVGVTLALASLTALTLA